MTRLASVPVPAPALVALTLAFAAGRAASMDDPTAMLSEFDPSRPPAAIGESLSDVLARWGERAVFGADCGSWRGASVDLDVRWSGTTLRVMALLRGDRVTALRFERTPPAPRDFAQCEAQLDEFQPGWTASGWTASGAVAGGESRTTYDGPVVRAVRPATGPNGAVGTFEADYRASRGECRVALIVTRP